jgi:hypothetical protein
MYIDHIVPAAIVLVDFILNRVPFKRRHLVFIVPLMLAYGSVNIAVSLARGQPIYAPLDPHKFISYVIAFSLPIFSSLMFLGWEWVSIWKIKKYDKHRKVSKIQWEQIIDLEAPNPYLSNGKIQE